MAPSRRLTEKSVAATAAVAANLRARAGDFITELNEAFLSGLAVSCVVVACVAAAGSFCALRYLPARQRTTDLPGADIDDPDMSNAGGR